MKKARQRSLLESVQFGTLLQEATAVFKTGRQGSKQAGARSHDDERKAAAN
jgi:hypothetical protein